jgi:hypothetical protein
MGQEEGHLQWIKENQVAMKQGKWKKGKGKDMKLVGVAHEYKNPINHCKNCNVDGHTK